MSIDLVAEAVALKRTLKDPHTSLQRAKLGIRAEIHAHFAHILEESLMLDDMLYGLAEWIKPENPDILRSEGAGYLIRILKHAQKHNIKIDHGQARILLERCIADPAPATAVKAMKFLSWQMRRKDQKPDTEWTMKHLRSAMAHESEDVRTMAVKNIRYALRNKIGDREQSLKLLIVEAEKATPGRKLPLSESFNGKHGSGRSSVFSARQGLREAGQQGRFDLNDPSQPLSKKAKLAIAKRKKLNPLTLY